MDRHRDCLAANEDLKRENKHIEGLLAAKDGEIEELENKIKILKLAQNLSGDESDEKTEIKRKINEYIREIDRCIAMLND